jgi:hypothetical protein
MDCDKVLVLECGRFVEIGHPYELIQSSRGYFRSFLDESGLVSAMNLIKIAVSNYFQNRKRYCWRICDELLSFFMFENLFYIKWGCNREAGGGKILDHNENVELQNEFFMVVQRGRELNFSA